MQSQPRWAWWVVGILIPVIGIAVTIWAANPSSDSDSSDPADAQRPPAAAGTASGTATGGAASGATNSPQGAPPAADTPRKVLVGPVEVTIDADKSYLELDTAPPMVMQSNDSADLVGLFNIGKPVLNTESSAKTIGLLPAEGPDPTAAECTQAVDKRAAASTDLVRGTRLCVETDEGHMAYLRVMSAVAINTPVRFQVTVWE